MEGRRFDVTVRNGTVVTASSTVRADIGIVNGRVAAIAPALPAGLIDHDATGLHVLPGGVDSHCHIEQKTSTGLTPCDDFFTASIAALCGGTTTLIPFACQHRGQSVRKVVDAYRLVAAKCACDYAIHIIVSDPAAPGALDDLRVLFGEGYTSVKAYMTYDALKLRDDEMLELFVLCRTHGAIVMVHAESHDLIAWITRRLLDAERTLPRYHAIARPAIAEREATHRAVTFAELIGTPLLLVHVSSAEAAAEVADARRRGLAVFGETCPQYLTLTRESLARPHDAAKYLCSPPLRGPSDQHALWRGLADGSLSVVSSDHSAYHFEAHDGLPMSRAAGWKPLASKTMVDEHGNRLPFSKVPMGLPGLECRLPLLLSHGVGAGHLDLQRVAALSATNPARLYGLHPRKGTIVVGSDADLVLWDLTAEWTVTKAALHDSLDYTPYEGQRLQGAPVLTLIRGRVAFRRSSVRSALNVGALDEVLAMALASDVPSLSFTADASADASLSFTGARLRGPRRMAAVRQARPARMGTARRHSLAKPRLPSPRARRRARPRDRPRD